jgi:hypothetical protein
MHHINAATIGAIPPQFDPQLAQGQFDPLVNQEHGRKQEIDLYRVYEDVKTLVIDCWTTSNARCYNSLDPRLNPT